MAKKEELVINIVHDKVNKDDIYFIGIVKKLLTELDPYIFQHKHIYSRDKGFGIFILKKEENDLFKESELSHIFLNYYTDIHRNKLGRMLEYKISDEYILLVYCNLSNKTEIDTIMKSNISTLQLLFTNENLKIFQQKILDVFGLYGCFAIIQMLFYYLNGFYTSYLLGGFDNQRNLGVYGIYGEGDVTIDISILEKIIQEGKEKFQDKLDLLYLLFSNINKRKIQYTNFDNFFNFPKYCIKILKKTNVNINQKIDGEFKTYSLKVQYLCSYIFKEFFDEHVYGGSKDLLAFYDHESLCRHIEEKDHELVGEKVHIAYKKFNVKKLKRLSLLLDKQFYNLKR